MKESYKMEVVPDQIKILIVDDNANNIKILGAILRGEGFQIYVANNGLESIVTAKKVIPDLILLDVMMPEMGGFEACNRLKEIEETKEIPIIFLTARVKTKDIVQGFEIGAVDYITKPFETTELLSRINTHLKIALLQNELMKANEDLEQRVIEKTTTIISIEKTLKSEVNETIISTLEPEAKSWFVDALKGIMIIDKRMDDLEIAYLRTILTFLGNKSEAERLLSMMKAKEPTELEPITMEKESAFEILTILMKMAIVDGKLSQSEANYILKVGRLLGFDNGLIRRILAWGKNRVDTENDYKQVKKMVFATQQNFKHGPQSAFEARIDGNSKSKNNG